MQSLDLIDFLEALLEDHSGCQEKSCSLYDEIRDVLAREREERKQCASRR